MRLHEKYPGQDVDGCEAGLVDNCQQPRYRDGMARPRHPNKHIQKAIRDASRPRIGPRKNQTFPARMLILFLPRSPLSDIGTQADGAEGLADATRSSPSVLFRRRCKDRCRRHSGP